MKLIYSYSRQEAIDDGVLIDVTPTAKTAGIRFPVAITNAVYRDCVAWDEKANKKAYQDEEGRLWDILTMFLFAAKRSKGNSEIIFSLVRIPREGKGIRPREVQLKAICGPGDDLSPVITIMMPNED